jgi:hypothetical protein
VNHFKNRGGVLNVVEAVLGHFVPVNKVLENYHDGDNAEDDQNVLADHVVSDAEGMAEGMAANMDGGFAGGGFYGVEGNSGVGFDRLLSHFLVSGWFSNSLTD